MNEQTKMTRQLELLIYLSTGINRTIDEICTRFEISESTARRHLRNFKNIGFYVTCKEGFYHISKDSPFFKEINELLVFSSEEIEFLKSLLLPVSDSSSIKIGLLQRLNSMSQVTALAKQEDTQNHIQNIHFLDEAIKMKRCVKLLNYHSASSSTVTNRTVEPFAITKNYESVWAYDPQGDRCKTFKILRIGEVQLLKNLWENEHKHKQTSIDVFGMSGIPSKVRFHMTVRAKNLLKEEHPDSSSQIYKIAENRYEFRGYYHSESGILRFVMGLLDEIEIIEPNDLKDAIAQKMESFLSNVGS